MMIQRPVLEKELKATLGRSRATALPGPRQCGKSTLARRQVPPQSPNYFDLEKPGSLARLNEPMTALKGLKGAVVPDEVQRRPELFPILGVLADRRPVRARFLIPGRASRDYFANPRNRWPAGWEP